MDPILYIYDIKNLNKLKRELSNFKFCSIAYLLYKSTTTHGFSDGAIDTFENIVIDLTNLLIDKNGYQISIEQLLYALSEYDLNLHFCINYVVFDKFIEEFPYFFDNEQINMNFHTGGRDDIVNEKTSTAPININNVTAYGAEICKKLKGHDRFKSDFQHSLQKFIFLNEIGERKIMSIILFGESGIGKTQFAKFASEVMYPEEPLIKINFGNYSSEGVLNSLIGSPLGYIGSEEDGELINKIKTSKSKIILIDEFEKATPGVHNFFYELLDEGVFTDRHGISHDLDGYIIIFTSNMTQDDYLNKIPDSLKSRFDMVCNFVGLSIEEKQQYIQQYIEETAIDLIEKLGSHYNVEINIHKIKNKLHELCGYNNLRTIKRNVEDIVFTSFFEAHK